MFGALLVLGAPLVLGALLVFGALLVLGALNESDLKTLYKKYPHNSQIMGVFLTQRFQVVLI